MQSYGAVWMDKRLHTAHRVAWLLTYGEIEKGKCVGQRCGNPLCVRPTHLVSGTKKELYDLRQKLGLGGEDPMALTEGQAREIREHYFHDRIPMASLARHYGVGLGAIDKVLRQSMCRLAATRLRKTSRWTVQPAKQSQPAESVSGGR